jgi:hypothetical protein
MIGYASATPALHGLLTVCTRCNPCRLCETYVHVGFDSPLERVDSGKG